MAEQNEASFKHIATGNIVTYTYTYIYIGVRSGTIGGIVQSTVQITEKGKVITVSKISSSFFARYALSLRQNALGRLQLLLQL